MGSRLGLTVVVTLAVFVGLLARADAATIHFKNGTVLNNVEILRENWRQVEVRISEAVTLFFSIEEINKIERERHHAEPLTVSLEYAGARVPIGLNQKLTQSIAVNYPEPTNFTEMLSNMGELYDITIVIDQKVKDAIATGALDPLWTFTKGDGDNVLDMLNKLVEDKKLAFEFSDGTVVITLPKQPAVAAATPTATVPPPPPPAPQ
jgi:hypothetical protein